MMKAAFILALAALFAACSTSADSDSLPESVVQAPANPADPSDPDSLPAVGQNANPAPDVSLNRGVEMPGLLEPGDTINPAETGPDETVPINTIVRFEDGTTVTIRQAGIVQGSTLQHNLGSLEGVDALDPDGDYVFVRAQVTQADAPAEAVSFRTQLTAFDTDTEEVTPLSMNVLGQGDEGQTLYLISESPISDDFFLESLQIIGPDGLITANLSF